jgi:hypothetical protein
MDVADKSQIKNLDKKFARFKTMFVLLLFVFLLSVLLLSVLLLGVLK